MTSIKYFFQSIKKRFIFDDIFKIQIIENRLIFQFQDIDVVIVDNLR